MSSNLWDDFRILCFPLSSCKCYQRNAGGAQKPIMNVVKETMHSGQCRSQVVQRNSARMFCQIDFIIFEYSVSPRSGKHSLTSAYPNRKKQKQQRPSSKEPKHGIFPGICSLFWKMVCTDENSMTMKCPSPKQRPTQTPK